MQGMGKGLFFFFTLTIVFVLSSCSGPGEEIARLNAAIRSVPDNDPGSRVVILQQIQDAWLKSNNPEAFSAYLRKYRQTWPNDPYRSYVIWLQAKMFDYMKQPAIAALYYQKALRTGPDVVSNGESIRYNCVQSLLATEKDPFSRIKLYKYLLEEQKNKIDSGLAWYELGFLYEQAADFPSSRQAFQKFLEYPQTVVPGRQHVTQRIRERLSLYDSPRDWSYPDRTSLVNSVKTAIRNRDTLALVNMQAKVNFFTISWLQEQSDFNSIIHFDIRRFDLNTAAFSDTLESISNSQEAYLKTWGWSSYIPIWYLYFRKIDFPADPEFNGTWEWAGIYFGDTIQELPQNRGL